MTLQGGCGPLQVDRVPQHDGRRDQVQAAGSVTLLLKTAVADLAQSDVTFPMVGPCTFQRMIQPFWAKRCFIGYQQHHCLFEPHQIKTPGV